MPQFFQRPWHVALLCTLAAFAWQWLLVTGYFQGHWSGLFLAGSQFPLPPSVQEERTFVWPNSPGYDGQFYHMIAHDPLDLHGTDRFIDAPHVRYSRILLPGLSYVLGFSRWVDGAYFGLELASVFLGVVFLAALARDAGRSVWWGAAFPILPPVFMSLERGLVDLPLCALTVAALWSAQRNNSRACWLALAASGLVRDMGLVACAAFALVAVRRGRPKSAAAWALATAPALAWNAYVMLFIPRGTPAPVSLSYPLYAVVQALGHFTEYPFGSTITAVLHVSDRLAVVGILLAFALGAWIGIRGTNRVTAVALTFAVFGLIAASSPVMEYSDPYSYCRQNGPLLLALLIAAIQSGRWALLLPLALVLPRAAAFSAWITGQSLLSLIKS